VIADPPVAACVEGAVKAMFTVLPTVGTVATNAVGASGVVRGVTVVLPDTAPLPAAFTARIVTV
jgi:hypothetical protein